jgi:thymidylate kinase
VTLAGREAARGHIRRGGAGPGRLWRVAVLVEGPDFAGKSTCCALLAGELARRGVAVRHSVGGLTSLTDTVYRALPASHATATVRTAAGILLRDAVFLASPVLDAVARPWLWRRAQVVVQEGYFDRVLSHHLCRGHRLAAACARRARRLVDFDLRVYLDVSFEQSRARYLASGTRNERDDLRFGPGAARHRKTLQSFRDLGRDLGYEMLDTGRLTAVDVAEHLCRRIDDLLVTTGEGGPR